MRKSRNRAFVLFFKKGGFASFVQVFEVLFSRLLVAFFKKSLPLVALVLLADASEHRAPH
jgi:hypothetical protein